MANICCDDVIFYTEGNPEGLYDLWEDLETYIILNQNPDLCWIGNLFSHKKIDSTGISLRGNVSYMEWNDTYILLSLETAWTPLYEAYQAIAAAYHVPFVMQSIEPGERIYYNTDEAHLFFPDRYCVRLYEESLLTPFIHQWMSRIQFYRLLKYAIIHIFLIDNSRGQVSLNL